MPRLRDVVAFRPKLLFVGINPGLRSGAVGHHFAGKGNPFWRLLYAARLVPWQLTYEEDQKLAGFGIALTNLCRASSRRFVWFQALRRFIARHAARAGS